MHRVGGRIVDDDIDAAIKLHDLLNQGMNVVAISHVSGDAGRFQTIAAKLICKCCYRRLFAAAKYHASTGLCQATCHRRTDALTRPGDQGNLAVEAETLRNVGMLCHVAVTLLFAVQWSYFDECGMRTAALTDA